MAEEPEDGKPVDGPTDGSLMRRLRGGNEDAAAQLYSRYAQRLRLLARTKTSVQLARRVDAEDIVQSVFRVFFTGARRGMYEVPADEDLWNLLLIIALNKIRGKSLYHNAAKRDVRTTADLERLEPQAEPGTEEDHAATFLRLVVSDTLENLRPLERRMVELRMEGFEMGEIADRVHRSKRTVERILLQARTRLKQVLDED